MAEGGAPAGWITQVFEQCERFVIHGFGFINRPAEMERFSQISQVNRGHLLIAENPPAPKTFLEPFLGIRQLPCRHRKKTETLEHAGFARYVLTAQEKF